MQKRTKEAIRGALFEATFVVLGVVLALSANEWRQARADRAQSQQAIVAIIQELKANRHKVSAAADYHYGLLHELNGKAPDWRPPMSVFAKGFIAPARTARTAWASASETGALAKTDYGTVMALSQAYALQAHYEAQVRSISDIIYGDIFRRGMQAVLANHANLASTINTLVFRERELIQAYDDILKGNANHAEVKGG